MSLERKKPRVSSKALLLVTMDPVKYIVFYGTGYENEEVFKKIREDEVPVEIMELLNHEDVEKYLAISGGKETELIVKGHKIFMFIGRLEYCEKPDPEFLEASRVFYYWI